MKIQYKKSQFNTETLKLIKLMDEIVSDYHDAGYNITLRQLYYQLVSKNLISNKESEYKRIGKTLGKARLAGLIDWEIIIDRIRSLSKWTHWSSPAQRIRSAANWYRINTRSDQPHYLEVWIEKDALASVVEPVCDENDIPLFVCRGYASITSKHEASLRMKKYADRDPVIVYLGDHDPSGLDMPRDIRDSFDVFGCDYVEIRRIALTKEQVEDNSLPPNPAKISDSRAKKYIQQHGQLSWELDALPPEVLTSTLQSEIDLLTDIGRLETRRWMQDNERRELRHIANKMECGDCNYCED